MLCKVCVVLAGIAACLALAISGCSPSTSSTDLSLKFSPDQTATYKSVSEVIKDFRFEQPNLGKLREEQTKTAIDLTFTQMIESVDAEGNATAAITIDALAVNVINKNETKFAFDSSTDTASPLAKLLGQRYKIQISPAGQVKVLDAKDALAAVPAGYEKKLASSILDEPNIIARHQIEALPKETPSKLAVGSSWSRVEPSPPGLLAPKSYKKTYTLTGIDTQGGATIATVEMAATEDAAPAKETSAGSNMGMFAKMFDNEDSYKGSMVIDLDTGVLQKTEETLVSTYLAQETPENGDPAKGPDTLTMTFTNRTALEKIK